MVKLVNSDIYTDTKTTQYTGPEALIIVIVKPNICQMSDYNASTICRATPATYISIHDLNGTSFAWNQF